MSDKIRNEITAYGLEILKRSVLLVLYDAAKHQPSWRKAVSMREIIKQLDLPQLKKSKEVVGNPTDLVRGILQHLQSDDLAAHPVHDGWEITPEGIEFIEG